MRIIFSLVIIFIYTCSYAQEVNCDTLTQSIKAALYKFSKTKTDVNIENFNIYRNNIPAKCDIARVYARTIDARINLDTGNVDLGLQKLEEADRLAQKTDHNTVRKDILKLIADAHFKNGEKQKAIEMVKKSISISCHSDSTKCRETNIGLLINLGLYYSRSDKYEQAIQTYHQADSLAEVLNPENLMYRAAINNSLGVIKYTQTKNKKESLEYFRKSFSFCPEGYRGKISLATNIATMYKELGVIDSTTTYLDYVIKASNVPVQLVSPHLLLGSIEQDSSNYNEAADYYSKALDYAIKSGQAKKIKDGKYYLGHCYYLLGRYREADNLLHDVEQFYKKSPPQKTTLLEFEKYYNLNKVALNNPKHSQALLNYFVNYDSLYGAERQEKLNNLVFKYEDRIISDSLAAIKLTAENQSLEIKNQRLSIFSLGSILSASLLGLFLIFKRLKESKIKNEKLVFQNNELQKLNEQLEQKTMTLSAIPIVDTETKEVNIKTKDKTYFVPTDSITYVQAEDDGVRVYYDNLSKWTDVSLKNFQEQIGETYFVQIARGVVVNVKHIAWINTNTLKMKAGAELKIGRTYKPKIKKILES